MPEAAKKTAEETETAKAAIIALNTDKDKNRPVEMVTMFSIDGTEYKVPSRVKPIIALRYLNDVRVNGMDVAAANMLYKLLGEDAWNALLAYEDLTDEEFQSVMSAMHELMASSLEGPATQGFKPGR